MKRLFSKFCMVLIALILFAAGCNPEKHHQTLSLFFDGVPKPKVRTESIADSSSAGSDSSKPGSVESFTTGATATVSVHPVYKPNNCEQCHDVKHSYRLNQRQPALCYHCHEDFSKKYTKLHGPVAAGYCTACHSAHQSEYEHLLKHPARENCQYCHHAGDVAKNSAHEDISAIECMECHNPHGGEDNYFLN